MSFVLSNEPPSTTPAFTQAAPSPGHSARWQTKVTADTEGAALTPATEQANNVKLPLPLCFLLKESRVIFVKTKVRTPPNTTPTGSGRLSFSFLSFGRFLP